MYLFRSEEFKPVEFQIIQSRLSKWETEKQEYKVSNFYNTAKTSMKSTRTTEARLV